MKLKDEDIKQIAKLFDQNESKTKIATLYSLNVHTLERLERRYKLHGIDGLLHGSSKAFSIDEKISIINRYYAGKSITSLAIEINVSLSVVWSWIKKYEKLGYNGLIDNRGKPGVSKMGRPKKNQTQEEQASTIEPMAPVTDAEREELNRLRKENYQLKLENECLKKIQALVQQRQNRQMKKK